jgi:cytochrome c oxidase subunit 2
MPCHEYCGLGHSEMLATVRVVPKEDFHPGPDRRVTCAEK